MRRLAKLSAAGLFAALASLAGAQAVHTTAEDVRHAGRLAIEQNPNLDRHPSAVLVRFEAGIQPAARERALLSVGGTVVRQYTIVPGLEHWGVSVDVDQAIAMLSAMPGVLYAEPDFIVRPINTPNDQYIGLQWGIHNTGQSIQGVTGIADADIDGFEAWDTSTGDPNFVIAVIDTGTQWSHPDLDLNIWSNPGEVSNGVDDDGNGYVDDIRGWDFYNNDNNPDDTDGHGTHTAGTVGAEGNNGIGVAGVNWRCKIVPLRFLGPNGGTTSDAIEAVQYCTTEGIKVSNNSWGGGGYSQSLYNAINASKNVGHVFVAAAGNSGQNTDSFPSYPASYNLDNIISVAATDNRDRLASFSNYGANSVDLGAPGVNVASTYSGSSYVWLSGTSMASPHVAGVVALVYAQNPGWTYQQVRNQILSTTRPISALSGKSVTGGVVNAQAALAGGGSGNTPPSVAISSPGNGSTFSQGSTVTFSGSASDAEDGSLSASLVWTSNLQGQIGTGATFSRSDLVVGNHIVTASVTDSDGANDTDTVSFTIQSNQTPPNAPGTPSIQNLGGGSVRVTWPDNSNNETVFEIRRQQRVGNSWTNTTTVGSVGANVTSFTNTPGVGYWRYSVRAGNAAGFSAWSSWRAIRLR